MAADCGEDARRSRPVVIEDFPECMQLLRLSSLDVSSEC